MQNKLPKVVLVLIDFGKSAGPEALAGLVLHIQIFHAFILVFFNIFPSYLIDFWNVDFSSRCLPLPLLDGCSITFFLSFSVFLFIILVSM